MLYDTYPLKDLLRRIFKNPKLVIEGSAKASGQRVVYFCHFEQQEGEVDSPQLRDAHQWGPMVLKVSEGNNSQTVAYLEKEIEILNGFDSRFYPKLLFNCIYSHDPDTEVQLPQRLFVTIEERIEAVPLSSCMDRFRNPSEAIKLLGELLEALKLMWNHPSKLVHRDLKPDNILIKPDGSVVIIDLAILREEGTVGLTNSHVPWGPCSLPYASPEQVENDKRNISFKTDIFQLGIMMYELISGNCPFMRSGASAQEIRDRICDFDPPLLNEQLAKPGLAELIKKMLNKKPYQRFRRIEDFQSGVSGVILEYSKV